MSWAELERLVNSAESNLELRAQLRHCRSQVELILAARRLGYHITRIDLLRAWQQHQSGDGQKASGS